MAEQEISSVKAIDQFLLDINAFYGREDVYQGGNSRGSMLNPNANETFRNSQAERAKWYPQAGETYDQWLTRLDSWIPGTKSLITGQTTGNNDSIVSQSINYYRDALRDGTLKWTDIPEKVRTVIQASDQLQGNSEIARQAGQFSDPNKLGQVETTPGQSANPEPVKNWDGKKLLQEFADRMMAPLDPNDPYVQQITNNVTAGVQAQNIDRGLGNQGIAQSNVADIVSKNQIALGQQRNQLGLGAIGQIQAAENADRGFSIQEAQLAQQKYQAEWSAMNQGLLNQYNSDKAGAQGLWGTVAGVGGGIIGGYFGGAAGAQVGFTAGSSLGAGAAGAGYGPAPTTSYNAPSLGFNSSGSGNKSGGSRGGNY